MATKWQIGFEVHPYQIRYHVHAYARTQLRDDPGRGYRGACKFFRVNYGTDSRPDYDIICRGVCANGGTCTVQVTRLRRGGPQYSVSDYRWECVCRKPARKAKKKKKAKRKAKRK